MIWAIIYITAVLAANYTATWFIPMPVFGLVALGAVIFGVTFTARDYVHRLGRPRVYVMIVIAAWASMMLSVAGSVSWRIVLASTIAILLSETADTEIYHRLLSKRWLVRVTGSNVVSIPLDTALFNVIAFLGVFAVPMLVAIMWGEIVVKFASGAVVALWRLR
ncbi:MAG: VUT family protein [Candidatus Altiarchaeales archaeon]|nr:VUT family protein [Candidatus Altiarchaeales archaeon]